MSKAGENPPRRRYDASGRRAKAAQTRARVIAAAYRVSIERGYAGATIPLIAAAAGVAVETVYRAAPGKAGLLAEAVQAALAGGAARAEQPVEQRRGIRRVIDEPDPRRAIRLYAGTQPGLWARTGPLLRVLDAAAPSDPRWSTCSGGSPISACTARGGWPIGSPAWALRRDLPVDRARDVVWTLCAQANFDALVTTRGWSHDEYRDWLAELLASALLGP